MSKRYITREGAEELRKFANAITVTLDNIGQSTDKLLRVYSSVENSLGGRTYDFGELLNYIASTKDKAKDAIDVLPKELNKTAAKIDSYLNKRN